MKSCATPLWAQSLPTIGNRWPKTSDLIGKFITHKYAFLDNTHNNLQSGAIITQYIVSVCQSFFFFFWGGGKFKTKSFKNISITFPMSVHMQKLLNHGASNHEIWHWGFKHSMLTGAVRLKLHSKTQQLYIKTYTRIYKYSKHNSLNTYQNNYQS